MKIRHTHDIDRVRAGSGGMLPRPRIGAGLLLAALMSGNHAANAADAETSVCGTLREPLAFWLFRSVAGAADARRIAAIRDIERLALKTRDGRTLGGYRLRHPDPRGYLLVVPGNAMLADQIAAELQFFRDLGLDVYVYDYRGYGLSSGRSRFAAIVGDTREIVAHLNGPGLPPASAVRGVHGRRGAAQCHRHPARPVRCPGGGFLAEPHFAAGVPAALRSG